MTARRTLRYQGKPAIFGRHGSRVRVYEELHRGVPRVVVEWREQGRRRKQTFAATREGEREACAWAEGFSESRGEGVGVRERVTLRELWQRNWMAAYPPLREAGGFKVAQAEHSLYVGEQGVEVLTR